MLKIGSAVHTAHGPGTITEADTVRGRTQYKVSGTGFDVWLDETKIAASQASEMDEEAGHRYLKWERQYDDEGKGKGDPYVAPEDRAKSVDELLMDDEDEPKEEDEWVPPWEKDAALGNVDESNSTTLPYDYTPQHPTEMYDEQTITPDHEVDYDERMTPTNSVTGESEEGMEYPGPNPDLFAKSSALRYADLDASVGEGGGSWDPSWGPMQDNVGVVMPVGAGIQGVLHNTIGEGIQNTLGDTGIDPSMRGQEETPAFNPGPKVGGIRTAAPGSFRHYLQWANDSGMSPDDDTTANLYGQTHGVDGFNLMNKFRNQRGPRTAAGGWGDVDVDAAAPNQKKPSSGTFDHYVEYATRNGMDPTDDLTADRYSREHSAPLERATDYAKQFGNGRQKGQEKRTAPTPATMRGGSHRSAGDAQMDSYRPAGLSDKYIDIYASAPDLNNPVEQFRHDPVGTIQRTAYLAESSGLDPRVGQYMDLVDADPMIRQAAWSDVRAKAMRLRREGKVHVNDIYYDRIYATVEGDNGTYDVMVKKGSMGGFGGGHDISHWRCGCEWGKWAFKRKKTFIGRLCSHGYASYLTMQSKAFRNQPAQKRLPRPPKRRRSSVLDDYKTWAKEVNGDTIDMQSADAYIAELEEAPTASEAKKIYDYVSKNMTQRPQRIYDVKGYTFDPNKVYDGGNGHDNALLRSQGKPNRLSPDLYRVPEGEGQYFTDLGDDRKTTGPDQIMAQRHAKVEKNWAKKHSELDDDHDPIVHFSMRKEALTYTADEGLLTRLRDLSAESNAENYGNMAQHNHEIAEVIDELRDRGYDASRLVASLRTADLFDWFGELDEPGRGGLTSDEMASSSSPGWLQTMTNGLRGFGWDDTQTLNNRADDNQADDGPIDSGEGDPAPAPATPASNPGGAPAPATPASNPGGAAPSGGGGAPDGGSNWSENTNMDPIGPGEYTIQSGDTYSNLAERAGWGDDYQGFANATGYQADNPDMIYAGDTLNVVAPPGSDDAPAAAAPEPGGSPPTSGTPGAPPAPSDNTSGISAPDPGVGGGLGFLSPPPANEAAPNAAYQPLADPTDPGLSDPVRIGSRWIYAEEEDEDLLGGAGGATQGIGGGPAGAASTVSPPTQQPTQQPTQPAAPDSDGDSATDPLPRQMETENFNSRPTSVQQPDGSTRVEEEEPQSARSTSDPMADFSSGLETVMPILEGIGSTVIPLATQALSPIATGIGNAIGNGLSGLFTAGVAADGDDVALEGVSEDSTVVDPAFAGSGPSRKNWYSTSEDWLSDYEYEDLNDEPNGDLIRHSGYDGTDIVRQFQANIGNTALGSSAGGGGNYSDDAIAKAAQGFLRTAGRVYSLAEQQALMDEEHPQGARNLSGLDLRGTHYVEG